MKKRNNNKVPFETKLQIEEAANRLIDLGHVCLSLAVSYEITDTEKVFSFIGDAILNICKNMLDVDKL